MVKKFVKSTTLTTKRPSSAFTSPVGIIEKELLLRKPTNQGITQRTPLVRLSNRAVPLNPQAPPFKPRSGNFGTKRIRGL